MDIVKSSLVLLFVFCLKGTSSFHGCLSKILLTNRQYAGRKIEENQIFNLVPSTHEQYFILIHDAQMMSSYGKDDIEWYERLRRVLISRYPGSAILETFWEWDTFVIFNPTPESIQNVAADYLFLYNLLTDNGVDPQNIIIIGHGYGALIASVSAETYEEVHGYKIGRLVALDPEESSSYFPETHLYVSKTDATFVMAVHTVNGPSDRRYASIEFYPNGGENQPGCDIIFEICSNKRSYEYLISAVSHPEYFEAYKCHSYEEFLDESCEDDTVSLGDLETKHKGTYFLKTRAGAPYFKEREPRLSVHFPDNEKYEPQISSITYPKPIMVSSEQQN